MSPTSASAEPARPTLHGAPGACPLADPVVRRITDVEASCEAARL